MPEEFAAAEQLVKDEDPDECRNEDVHEIIHIFDGLIDEPRPELPFGHPIDAYRREVDEMKELLRKGDELISALPPFETVLSEWEPMMTTLISAKCLASTCHCASVISLGYMGFRDSFGI